MVYTWLNYPCWTAKSNGGAHPPCNGFLPLKQTNKNQQAIPLNLPPYLRLVFSKNIHLANCLSQLLSWHCCLRPKTFFRLYGNSIVLCLQLRLSRFMKSRYYVTTMWVSIWKYVNSNLFRLGCLIYTEKKKLIQASSECIIPSLCKYNQSASTDGSLIFWQDYWV